MTTALNRGAVATLADVAARLVNGYAITDNDTTGQAMAKVRTALIAELQRALADVYPDPRDHNAALTHALQRRVGRSLRCEDVSGYSCRVVRVFDGLGPQAVATFSIDADGKLIASPHAPADALKAVQDYLKA